MIYSIYDNMNDSSAVLIGLAIMLLVAFLLTRLTKPLKLPNVTVYIFAGLLIGPIFKLIFKTNLIKPELITGMDFLTDIALAFIGKYEKILIFIMN